jgi:hypothetical protein
VNASESRRETDSFFRHIYLRKVGGEPLLASERQKRYLLGNLSERERERLEKDYVEDDEAFEEMLIAEEELTDGYVRGELSEEESAKFSDLFLSTPRGRRQVMFARALADAVSASGPAEITPARPPRHSLLSALGLRTWAPRLALATVASLILVVLTWLLFERTRTSNELQRLRGERAELIRRTEELERRAADERERNEMLLAQLQGEQGSPIREGRQQSREEPQPNRTSSEKGGRQTPSRSVVAFVLTSGLVRGEGSRTLLVPRGASHVALGLKVEADTYRSYSAVIETADGHQVWSANAVKRGAAGVVRLPAVPIGELKPGDYILLLSGRGPEGGLERAAEYSFRIMMK